jgi:hypothetical protein
MKLMYYSKPGRIPPSRIMASFLRAEKEGEARIELQATFCLDAIEFPANHHRPYIEGLLKKSAKPLFGSMTSDPLS